VGYVIFGLRIVVWKSLMRGPQVNKESSSSRKGDVASPKKNFLSFTLLLSLFGK
jgi:hypothetical protein